MDVIEGLRGEVQTSKEYHAYLRSKLVALEDARKQEVLEIEQNWERERAANALEVSELRERLLAAVAEGEARAVALLAEADASRDRERSEALRVVSQKDKRIEALSRELQCSGQSIRFFHTEYAGA